MLLITFCKGHLFEAFIRTTSAEGGKGRITKTMRVMQLTAIFILAACLQVSATGMSQTVTFSGKNVPLDKVLLEVREQTGFNVIYSAKRMREAKPVTIQATHQPLAEFLAAVLEGQPLEYVIEKNTIFIRKKISPVVAGTSPQLSLKSDPPPVTGIVKGPDGQPLGGVNIIVKGTKRGTVSGGDGAFTIDAKEGETLIVSSIGFVERQLKITTDSPIGIIELSVSESKLDEVQVIAYGQTSRRLGTGNISTVKAADLEKQPVNNPLLALSGRVPGLLVEQGSGMPGSTVGIRIQGQNSIGSGNFPLFVIDGIPYPPNPSFSGNPEGILGGSRLSAATALGWLNVQDIESIDVLKDADATSIYGSRAANGAVLITTKKGRIGETRMDLNIRHGFSQIALRPRLLNTQQYLELRREAYTNAGLPVPDASIPDDEKNGSNYDLTVWDQNRYTDWQKELIGKNATYSNVQAAVSGGNTGTQYRIGATYNRESGVQPGDYNDQKASMSFSINSRTANQKLRIQLTGNYLVDQNKLPGRDLTVVAAELPPNAPALFHPNGTLNWERIQSGTDSVSTFNNPIAGFRNPITLQANNLTSSLNISYNIVDDLTIRVNLGYTAQQVREKVLFYMRNAKPEDLSFARDRVKFNTNNSNTWIAEPQLSYNKSFGKARAELLAGMTFNQLLSDYQRLEGVGFASEALIENVESAQQLTVQSGSAAYKYMAGFGRLNYNYNDKYIVNLTARRDGSSRFGIENRFHNFASVAGAWIFSNEQFVKNAFPFLNFGKLRMSYGTTGNDQIGDYSYLNLYYSSTVPRLYQGVTGLITFGLYNPYLQWEETRKLQAGIEMGWLKERILLSINYFRNRSSNQLLGYDLPYITGSGNISTNFPATVQNAGIEATINTVNIQGKHFNWSTDFNISTSKNKLIAFPGLETSSYANNLIIGEPVSGLVKAYRFAGLNATTGLYEFFDIHGNTTNDPGFGNENRTQLINTNPVFFGGMGNTVRYKQFELSLFVQFVKQRNQNYLYTAFTGFSPQNQLTVAMDRWRAPGDRAAFQKVSRDFAVLNTAFYRAESDASYIDASFARLKNMSLSYRLKDALLKKVGLKSFSLFVQGQNLLTVTNYPAVDPETRTKNSLPPMRVFTFGLNAGF